MPLGPGRPCPRAALGLHHRALSPVGCSGCEQGRAPAVAPNPQAGQGLCPCSLGRALPGLWQLFVGGNWPFSLWGGAFLQGRVCCTKEQHSEFSVLKLAPTCPATGEFQFCRYL